MAIITIMMQYSQNVYSAPIESWTIIWWYLRGESQHWRPEHKTGLFKEDNIGEKNRNEKRRTANNFNECNGTTRSSWSAVNSMVDGYWADWSEDFSQGLPTLCSGEYLRSNILTKWYQTTRKPDNGKRECVQKNTGEKNQTRTSS